ncbi:MAG: hypothetical protein KDE27_13710 [Planctomycetes bacterium]|nr:hypothetical protein [Planctomycetota bacterium]
MAASDPVAGPGSTGPDLDDPAALERAVREVALRLMAGAVPRATMTRLQKLMRENVGDYPWQEVTRQLLAESVDEQQLVQQGLNAQRDWVWRGGRETPRPPLGHRTKGFFAKICAQTIFLLIWAVVVVIALLALRHTTGLDIYAGLRWLYEMFPNLRR